MLIQIVGHNLRSTSRRTLLTCRSFCSLDIAAIDSDYIDDISIEPSHYRYDQAVASGVSANSLGNSGKSPIACSPKRACYNFDV